MSQVSRRPHHVPFSKLTTRQAAETLGVSKGTILRALDAGELKSETTIQRVDLIDALDLKAWFEQRNAKNGVL